VNTGGYEDEQEHALGNLWCGTSMATPFVTGTVALMIAKNPTIPHGDIRSIRLTHAQEAGDPSWDFYYGHGIVRADSAVAAVQPLLQATIAGPSEVQPDYPCN
jgi:subtilisin family serine protease